MTVTRHQQHEEGERLAQVGQIGGRAGRCSPRSSWHGRAGIKFADGAAFTAAMPHGASSMPSSCDTTVFITITAPGWYEVGDNDSLIFEFIDEPVGATSLSRLLRSSQWLYLSRRCRGYGWAGALQACPAEPRNASKSAAHLLGLCRPAAGSRPEGPSSLNIASKLARSAMSNSGGARPLSRDAALSAAGPGKGQLDTAILRAALCCVLRGNRICSPNPSPNQVGLNALREQECHHVFGTFLRQDLV